MESVNFFPALNFTALRAEILIFLPVRGFRPSRADRSETENVPQQDLFTGLSRLGNSIEDALERCAGSDFRQACIFC